MRSLVELAVFVRVAESRNLSFAARSLGITPSAVSKRLSKLEERIGVTLLHRTTRNVALSEDGRAFYERCKRILGELEEAERSVMHAHTEVRGTVRLAVPATLARSLLSAKLDELLVAHPHLSLDVGFSNDDVDPMRDGYDVVVAWGRPKDSALIQRKLTSSKVRVYGAARYLRRRGAPASPHDLESHECLSAGSTERSWVFKDGPRQLQVPVKSRVHCASHEAVKELAVAGLGLCREPELSMTAAGLETVLDDFAVEDRPLFARCAPAQPLAPRVRAVMDWLVESFKPAEAPKLR